MNQQTATIMGGGFAGMLSAIVLSPYMKKITLIDRYPFENGFLRGVPQSQHLHVMMAQGQQLLRILTPEVWALLQQEQLPHINWAKDTLWRTPQGQFPRYQSNICTSLFSRSLINRILFHVLNQQPNIEYIHAAVKTLDLDNQCIHKIRLDDKSHLSVEGLLIDARGRGTNIVKELGATIKSQQWVKNNYRYYSTIITNANYHLSDNFKQVYVQADPRLQAMGLVLSPIEHSQAVLTLINTQHEKLTIEQIKSAVHAIFNTHQLGEISLQESQWCRFNNLSNHRLKFNRNTHPKNLIIIGDALCYQNPVYGQGMTVTLQQLYRLKQRIINRQSPHQSELEKTLTIPWLIATCLDQKYRNNSGIKSRLFNKSFEWLIKAACSCPNTHHKLLHVLHQCRSPGIFLKPFSIYTRDPPKCDF